MVTWFTKKTLMKRGEDGGSADMRVKAGRCKIDNPILWQQQHVPPLHNLSSHLSQRARKLFSIKLTKKRRDGWAEPHLTFKKIFGYVICVMKESVFMIWTVYLWNENCICGMKSEFVGRKVNLWDEKWIFGINCVFLEWKVESGKWI